MRNGAPLLELSSYPFSKYINLVDDVDLANMPTYRIASRGNVLQHKCDAGIDYGAQR